MYQGFIQGSQFLSNDLNGVVNSDHAEVRCKVNGITFASVNISNKHHHHYFSSDPTGPFANTHLAVTKDSNVEARKWLDKKHIGQVNNIKNNLSNNIVDIYVIQEAYLEFIRDCVNILGDNYFYHYEKLSPVVRILYPSQQLFLSSY